MNFQRSHRMGFLHIAACGLLLLSSAAFAGGPGTTTAQLLKIPVGTRAVAMGEAFTAMADDSSALSWNPAGLSLLRQKEVTFMHSSLIESVHYEHLAFVAPGDSYASGVNFSYLGYGNIDGYNNAGLATGDVSAYSYVLTGGLSRVFAESLALGVSGGLVHETLADDSANTFDVNAGAIYALPMHTWGGHYRLGAAVQNLGPGLKFVTQRDPLPRRIKFGAAVEGLQKLPLNLTADITAPNDNDTYLSLGSEYWFKDMIALRLGYAGSNDQGKGLRAGFGLKYGGLLFDYAYAGFGDFGATNRVSFSMRFGDKIRQLNSDERAILKEARLYEKKGSYVPAVLAYDELIDRDPANDHVLHLMIKAHDKIAEQQEVQDMAERSVPAPVIPSPEDAAMAELLPEVPANDATAMARTVPEVPGDDPLGLNKLPEASTLDVAVGSPVKPALSATRLSSSMQDYTSHNSPALSPSDIYGN